MNDNWLAHIDPDTPINLLAIPGTHDSASWLGSTICDTKSGVAAKVARRTLTYTQRRNISQQLNDGVRALDMRLAYDVEAGYQNQGMLDPYSTVAPRPAQIWMCHNTAVFDVTFESQLQIISQFLTSHPHEFVILVLHQQGHYDKGGYTSHQLIAQKITQTPGLNVYDMSLHTGGWPTVGDLAGKVLVFSRLARAVGSWLQVGNGWGDHEGKTYFRRFQPANSHLWILLQDRYKGVTTPDPTKDLHNDLYVSTSIANSNRAKFILFDNMRAEGQPGDLKVNHLSHSLMKFVGHPWELGQTLNNELVNKIANLNRVYRGLLMIDDANEGVCQNLARLNRQLWIGSRRGTKQSIAHAATMAAIRRR